MSVTFHQGNRDDEDDEESSVLAEAFPDPRDEYEESSVLAEAFPGPRRRRASKKGYHAAHSSHREANKALCEAHDRGERVSFRESGYGVVEVRRVGKLFEAKIGQADKKNQNGRIYPRAVWQDQIDHFMTMEGTKTRLDDGQLPGAVDHQAWTSDGNLRDNCIIWRELSMDVDGGVFGKFEVVEKHSVGANLKANIDAGMAIGFSTYGYGTGHEAGDAERRQYGLSDTEYCVIMDRNFKLKKVDAVDDPSVIDARMKRESAARESADDVISAAIDEAFGNAA